MKKAKLVSTVIAAAIVVTQLNVLASVENTMTMPVQSWVMNTHDTLDSRMNTAVVLKPGDMTAYVNNKKVKQSTPPYFEGENVIVSLDFIAEAVGSVVEKDDEYKTVKIMRQTYTVDFKENNDTMVVRNMITENKHMGSPSVVKDGVWYIPVKDFVEALGLTYYKSSDNIVFICENNDSFDEDKDAGQIAELSALFENIVAEPIVLYVTPGDGGGKGTFENPYRGIEAAKEVVRKRLDNGKQCDITVYMRGGRYELDKTLTFNSSDSGNGHSVVTYKNYENETVYITPSRQVKVWKKYKDGIYIGRVNPKWSGEYLFENGERSWPARTPNEGWYTWTADPNTDGKSVIIDINKFGSFNNINSAKISYWHSGWFTAVNNITSIDKESGVLKTDENISGGASGSNRYFIGGVLEFLDQPGEFYDDKGGYVYYKPRSKDIKMADIDYPAFSGDIIKFQGENEENPVRNIRFDGVVIENSAGVWTGSGVSMTNTRNIYVENCIIRNTSYHGISISGNGKNNEVRNCHVYNTGKSGIELYGNYQGYIRTTLRNNKVINCHIHDVGQVLGEASCVHIFSAGYNEVKNNLCYNSPRYDISLAGFDIYTWQYRSAVDGVEPTYENRAIFGHVKNNIIAFNDCSNANTASDDTAPINLWNVDPGNIVYSNYVHDSTTPFGFHFGIYLDDKCENTLVRKNIVKNIHSSGNTSWSGGGSAWSVLMIKGQNNRVENNYLVDNPDMMQGVYQMFNDASGEEIPNKTCMNNIFMNSGENLYYYTGWREDALAEADGNIYYNDSGVYSVGGDAPMRTYDGWVSNFGGTIESSSKVANPEFMDDEDYRLKYTSLGLSNGIKDISILDIGLTKDYPYAYDISKPDKIYVREYGAEGLRSYINLKSGQIVKTEALVRSDAGFTVNDCILKYHSSSPGIATVDNEGNITGVSKGVSSVTVTATKNGKSVQTLLDILVDDSTKSIEIAGVPTVIAAGKSADIKVVATTELGRTYLVSDAEIRCSGFTIDEFNKATAKTEGTGTVTASYKLLDKTLEAASVVPIVDGMINKAEVVLSDQWVNEGDSVTAVVKAFNEYGSAIPAADMSIKYSIQNAKVISTENETATIIAERSGVINLNAEVKYHGVVKQVINNVYVSSSKELGDGWQIAIIGNSNGFVNKTDDGKYSMVTDSLDIFGQNDDFLFMYKEMDVSELKDGMGVTCTVNSYDLVSSDSHAVGVMIRNGLQQNASHAQMRVQPDGSIRGIYRKKDGEWSGYLLGNSVNLPYKLRVTREGSKCKFAYGTEESMTEIGSEEVTFDNKVYLGIAFMANSKGAAGAATVSDVIIK